MVITFGSVTLAGAGDHIEGYRESGEKAVDTRRPMRAKTGRAVDRGGEITRVSWTTVRDHDDHAAALAFLRSHRKALQTEAAGGTATVGFSSAASLFHATVAMAGGEAYGITTRIAYEVTGSEES